MSRYMRRRGSIPESKTLRIPADVWEALPGEDGRAWSERWKQWFRDRDFARGKTVFAPDGTTFFTPNGENARAVVPVFRRSHAVREWERTHPGR